MTEAANRRTHPRLRSSARILWSIVGKHDIQIDRLRDVSASGALVSTESVAKAGEEIRFDLLDDRGDRFATGLRGAKATSGAKPLTTEPDPWRLPASRLGKALGKLFNLFGASRG